MRIIRRPSARAERRDTTFTGTVWADPLLPTTEGAALNAITFAPGARTFWHTHENGQLLVVTTGSGWVCLEGEEPERLEAGDLVWAAPGEPHWHGAGPGSVLTHVALSLGTTAWLDEVTAAQYPDR